MDNLNFTIAKNLSALRRENGLTQLQLAQKLNYSDKAVSKWEQGESLPGIEILYRLSRLYGVSLDYIVGGSDRKKTSSATPMVRRNRRIITLLSVLAVWLTATVLYITFDIAVKQKVWMFFFWAVPISLIVLVVFSALWHGKKTLFTFISLLLWTVLLCFCLQFMQYHIWIVLAAGIPLQIAVFLWAWLCKVG